MQDCFREHPDVYGAELEDEESEPSPGDAASPVGVEPSSSEGSSPPSLANMPSHGEGEKVTEHKPHHEPDHPEAVQAKRDRSVAAKEQVASQHETTSESDDLMPKAWHDAK